MRITVGYGGPGPWPGAEAVTVPALLAVSRAVAGPVSVLTAGPGAGAGAGGAGARLGDTFCEPMDMDVGDDLIRPAAAPTLFYVDMSASYAASRAEHVTHFCCF